MANYYHGTKAKFTKFTKLGSGMHGPGFYFTPDKSEARYFAKSLAGDGSAGPPIIYEVELSFSNPYHTMSVECADLVAKANGFKYKVPAVVGGAKEHFHHLRKQMKKLGLIDGESGFNTAIKEAGFDCIQYEMMDHIIIFDSSKIRIVNIHDV